MSNDSIRKIKVNASNVLDAVCRSESVIKKILAKRGNKKDLSFTIRILDDGTLDHETLNFPKENVKVLGSIKWGVCLDWFGEGAKICLIDIDITGYRFVDILHIVGYPEKKLDYKAYVFEFNDLRKFVDYQNIMIAALVTSKAKKTVFDFKREYKEAFRALRTQHGNIDYFCIESDSLPKPILAAIATMNLRKCKDVLTVGTASESMAQFKSYSPAAQKILVKPYRRTSVNNAKRIPSKLPK